jgi:peroxiredoxin
MRLMTRMLLATFVAMLSVLVHADEYLKTMKDFELSDQHGVMHKLSEYEDKELLVVYVHGSGCPIARLSVPTYLAVKEDYADKNVEFLMLNAFIQDDIPRIKKEADDFKITFPILKDADQSVAKSLGVERTAEVFIIDPRTREVHFRGPIDDMLGYETQRVNANHTYLRDALDTVLAGGKVKMDDIPDAKGCLVGYFYS